MKLDWRIMGVPIQCDDWIAEGDIKHHREQCLWSGFATKQSAEEYLNKGLLNGWFRRDCFIKSQWVGDKFVGGENTTHYFLRHLFATPHRDPPPPPRKKKCKSSKAKSKALNQKA